MTDPTSDWTPIPGDVSLLPALRELYECALEVNRVASRHLDTLGLTPARFEILAALGDTDGMTVKELGEQSLTTKGNLLHVLSHLEGQGLVRRSKSTGDSRQTLVTLTPEGQRLYEQTFLVHVTYMRQFFDQLAPDELAMLTKQLTKLKGIFAREHA